MMVEAQMKTIRIMAIAVLSVGGGLALNVARTQQAGIHRRGCSPWSSSMRRMSL